MFLEIKNKIDQQLPVFLNETNRIYSLNKISPLLFECISDFVLRDGKRLRPVLFVMGYLGFAKKPALGLYTSAIAIELLHDFLLVHDDIIDKSDTRRGKPSMHVMLNNHLNGSKNIKFNGQDLSVVAGDVIYAMAIHAFLAIKENPKRKEEALENFIKAAIFTGSGEFIELLNGTKHIEKITQQDIYNVYDYKTAHYTFASPLSTGAILGGASWAQVSRLTRFGMCLGRAFQIKDDIIGMFGTQEKIGKSVLSDLQEAKITMLIWKAYKDSSKKNKKAIRDILCKKSVTHADLKIAQAIVKQSGALTHAHEEISRFLKKSENLLKSSSLKKPYKNTLIEYAQHILKIPAY